MSTKFGKGGLLRSTILAGFAAAGISGAAANAQIQVPEPQEEEETAGDRIVITGSRIARDSFSSDAPVDVFGSDDAVQSGQSSLAELMQSTTIAMGSSQSNAITSTQGSVTGGQGVETVSLRGLGANRTLVLLNGRRAGPAGVRGQVSSFDLNVIPLSAIERVEVLKDGASSIYGSDAVAGVVNIITRHDTGGNLDFYTSLSEDGGGEETRLSATYGWEFDRGNFSLTFDDFRRRELAVGDRDYLNCNQPNVLLNGQRHDVIDPQTGTYKCENLLWAQMWIYDYAYAYGDGSTNLSGRSNPNNIQFDYDGRLAAAGFTPVGDNRGGAHPSWLSAPDGWYFLDGSIRDQRAQQNMWAPMYDTATMVPETNRQTLYAQGEYELTDSITMYGEALLNRRDTQYTSYQMLWGYTYFEYYYAGEHDPDVAAAGWDGFSFNYPTMIAPYTNDTSVEYQRFVFGLEGDDFFNLDTWSWDMSIQKTRSEGEYAYDRFIADAIYHAYAGAGRPTCVPGDVTDVTGTPCVDLPWHDENFAAGNLTDDQANFIFGRDIGRTVYDQFSFDAIANGDVIELPAGTMGMAVGVHYRTDEINDTPGEIILADNAWGDSTAGITAGSDTTTAIFAEAFIPVFSNFDITASGRFTDVDSYGSGSTYKVGGNFRLNDDIRLRATYGTSFRTPGLFELYLADQSSIFDQRSIEVCHNYTQRLADGDISQNMHDNCQVDVPRDLLTGPGDPVSVFTGGGAGRLEAETSTSLNVGFVWAPSGQNFRLSVDYFEIEVNDQVDVLGGGNILSACYNSLDFANDPVCDLFTRWTAPDGSIPDRPYVLTVVDNYLNISSQTNSGIDLNADYFQDFMGGELAVNFAAAYQLTDTYQIFEGSVVDDNNGLAGDPKLVANLNFAYTEGDWSSYWGMRYIGATSNHKDYLLRQGTDQLYVGEDVQYVLSTEAMIYHDVSAAYEAGDWSFRAGVSNLFDEHPPSASNVEANLMSMVGTSVMASQYDYIGRRFFANISKAF
jgi:iron complex outermembrane receptor protein